MGGRRCVAQGSFGAAWREPKAPSRGGSKAEGAIGGGGTRGGAVVSSSPELGHSAAEALGGMAAGGRGCSTLGGARGWQGG